MRDGEGGMKTITFFSTLMRYAREEADARKSGNAERLAKATADHEAYRQLCLSADEMHIPNPSNMKGEHINRL
jgi:hypothetical protein